MFNRYLQEVIVKRAIIYSYHRILYFVDYLFANNISKNLITVYVDVQEYIYDRCFLLIIFVFVLLL